MKYTTLFQTGKLCLIFLCLLFPMMAFAQPIQTTLTVKGNCEQCKARIEKTALKAGALSASWDVSAKILSLSISPAPNALTNIEQALLKAGHDVNNIKAKEKAYHSLPECCLYRREALSDTILQNSHDTVQSVKKTPFNETLQGVTVTDRRRSSYIGTLETVRTETITQKELLRAACCNLSESLESNPSIDVSYNDAVTGSKHIQLLGLSGNYTSLTVENMPGPTGIAFAWGLNSIPGPSIHSIQLSKGLGSVVNGYEGIAGQINVELKKPEASEKLLVNGYLNDFGKTDLNLLYTQRLNSKWSTNLFVHNDFLHNTNLDDNHDGFRDLPTGNQYSITNRYIYQGTNGIIAQFGGKILADDRVGGQLAFNPSTDKLGNSVYGLGFNTNRYEGFAKIGYIFPQKKYQSIGLQLSVSDHTQDAYFGTNTYNAKQQNIYANLIFQTIIHTPVHKIKIGGSIVSDHYNEFQNAINYIRTETVEGLFTEYTFAPSAIFDIVAGIRADQNNLYGFVATPRLHIKYKPFKGTTLRATTGTGRHTANIFAENTGQMASARQFIITTQTPNYGAYGLKQEQAWNIGLSIDKDFKLFSNKASIGCDYVYTSFLNQVVVDLENPRQVQFYNLQGLSYSKSFQANLAFTPVKHLDIRLAYRYLDVKTTYNGMLLQKPLVSTHRFFQTFAYSLGNWKLDATINYNGSKRLPSTINDPKEYRLDNYSKGFATFNAQITRSLTHKSFSVDLYAGAENIGNFIQQRAIIASDKPFSQWFDASLVWGPTMGRMFYTGFRFIIK